MSPNSSFRSLAALAATASCLTALTAMTACGDGARMSPSGAGAQGAAAASAAEPPLPPAPVARYVKFVAVSEWGGKAWSAVAEFNLFDVTGASIERKRWAVSADSSDANDPPANAIDGDPRTLWHTRWQGEEAPLPHAFTVDLGMPLKLSGFRYLPRQDGTDNGTVAEYRLYISQDGKEWGEPVSAGDLRRTGAAASQAKTVWFAARTANHAPTLQTPPAQNTPLGQQASLTLVASDADGDPLTYSAQGLPAGLTLAPATGVIAGTPIAAGRHAAQLTVSDTKGLSATAALEWTVQPAAVAADVGAPGAGEVRFVKLEEISELNGKAWASIAEFNLLDANGALLPRTGWVASADSADANDQPQGAIDGNPGSLWHSQWDGAAPPPPHSFIVDMRRYARVGGFRLLPRQDGQTNGVIARWRFYTSVDGITWGKAVAEGDFSTAGKATAEKTVTLR